MNINIMNQYTRWLRNPFLSGEEKEYLRSIEEDEKKIEELFGQDLKFGTGGMRGIIGVGTNRINDYQVARAVQSFANIIIRESTHAGKGVVVGFDTRSHSREFAEIATRVLLGNGIRATAIRTPAAVPVVSYTIRKLELEGGIMITASHNPKEYNGVKLYGNYGGQLVPKDMQNIIAEFEAIQDFSQVHMYKGHLRLNSIYWSISENIHDKFQEEILKLAIDDEIDNDVGIVYSALHGTGARYVPEVLKKQGYQNVFLVEEQMEPDPNFSTVEKPNPEESEALSMAITLAEKNQGDLVMATDPDCDRVGAAVKGADGKILPLNGNQIGSLLLDYLIQYKKEKGENPVVIQTIVTGGLGKKIAKKNGIKVESVLTGFKYIGEMMNQLEGETFLFGYEESCGYLSGTHVRDKDGVNACMLLAEMAGVYKKQGKTIIQRLEELYEVFGYCGDTLRDIAYEGIDGMREMEQAMENVRTNLPKTLLGQEVQTCDYLHDETGLPKENVIRFELEDGSFAALRPSGTEPKLKAYFSFWADSLEMALERCEKAKEELFALLG